LAARIWSSDEQDDVWLIDDGGHVIYKRSQEGEILFTLGAPGVPGEHGTHLTAYRFDLGPAGRDVRLGRLWQQAHRQV
jgi:hypothetical protein